MIEAYTQVPIDVEKMALGEVRKQLVGTSLAYKGEKIRNDEFQRKLDGALRQLERKETTLEAIDKNTDRNKNLESKLGRMERERDRESQYG